MRIGGQDVQVIEDGDDNIEALEEALTNAEIAYEDARETIVSEEEEEAYQRDVDALKAAFDKKHRLDAFATRVADAKAALELRYEMEDDEENEIG